MATKSDRPGLLSKMAMFVRNPTKDWSELERPQVEQDSGFDKQVLKQMIERKRQNDFIRKREFDQLRKLRSKGISALAIQGRPSVFQSSMAGLTDPDGRAVTLKKIDEIEAQMSKQWWKGKQDIAAAKGAALSVASTDEVQPAQKVPEPPVPPHLIVPEQFDTTEASELSHAATAPNPGDFLATEMGGGMEPVPPPRPRPKARSAPMMGALAQSYDGAEVGFSTSKLLAIDVEDMATDPELEEAAIRFANGDDAGAEEGLLLALRGAAGSADTAISWAAALLDLYRATHGKTKFDQAVAEFSSVLGSVKPRWEVIGDEAPNAASSPSGSDARDYSVGAIWSCPAELNSQAMEGLRDAMASRPPPWHLDWSKLAHIADDAMPLMDGLFGSLCNEPVALRFSGAGRLVDTLRAQMPSGNQAVNPVWWHMRLNVLRTLQLLDDFELAALDYCVTYEVSPPAWQEARCQFSNVEDEADAANVGTPAEASEWGAGYSQMSTVLMGIEKAAAVQLELKGNVLGDATQALAGFDASGQDSDSVVVSCSGLIRVDFSAAGSILNWVAMRESEGCQVQFRDVHRLVAAFFNVIGINEHARVVPRAI
jgi:anti-anti-sigma regulatory factor